jgi:hypothetical protein
MTGSPISRTGESQNKLGFERPNLERFFDQASSLGGQFVYTRL